MKETLTLTMTQYDVMIVAVNVSSLYLGMYKKEIVRE